MVERPTVRLPTLAGQMVFVHEVHRNGAVIDVLAPDNIGPRARLRLGQGRTLSAPGTTGDHDGTGVVVRRRLLQPPQKGDLEVTVQDRVGRSRAHRSWCHPAMRSGQGHDVPSDRAGNGTVGPAGCEEQ